MQIAGDYPRPVMVNGYACNNCDDVSAAKRGQDPAEAKALSQPAVEFGGGLAGRISALASPSSPPSPLLDRYA